MAEVENDEVARARRWWHDNGTAAIVGVLIAIVVLAGWYGWSWYQARQNAQAATLYSQAINGIGQDNVTGGVVNAVDTLQNDYSGTPYGAAAAMALGAWYVDNQKLDKAASRLDWAAQHAKNKGIEAIATVREARIRWAQNQPAAALKLLASDHPAAFDALYAELAGDIHLAQGDRKAAHAAYQKALAHLPDGMPRQPLQQKLDSSAPAASSAQGASAAPGSASHNAPDAS